MKTLFALLAALAGSLALTANPFASILPIDVRGDVQVTVAGQTGRLDNYRQIAQGAVVKTGAGASVTLVFSNGSYVIVDESSEVSVDRYEQAPYDLAKGTWLALAGDPSESHAEVQVLRGQVHGHVRNRLPESSFQITSAIGTANILGTVYTVRFNGGRMTITNQGGTILAAPKTGTQWTNVPSGAYLEIDVQASGVVVTVYGGIPLETAQAVLARVEDSLNWTFPPELLTSTPPSATNPYIISASGGTMMPGP